MGRNLFTLIILTLLSLSGISQDTLPRFTLITRGQERIVVSWTNPYGTKIRQLSIQRSFDSVRNYTTILTLPDPTVLQNGYVDTRAINDHMFYRLYILLDSGKYLFSATKRPVADNGTASVDFNNGIAPGSGTGFIAINKPKDLQQVKNSTEHMILVKKKEVVIGAIPDIAVKAFRDSVNLTTRDTAFMETPDAMVIRLFNPREVFRASKFVFTEKDGNVKIVIADAATHRYALKFFEEDNTELFEIKQVKESMIMLDKTNFVHYGWFYFELYEDGKLKEKHKVYVPKDF